MYKEVIRLRIRTNKHTSLPPTVIRINLIRPAGLFQVPSIFISDKRYPNGMSIRACGLMKRQIRVKRIKGATTGNCRALVPASR